MPARTPKRCRASSCGNSTTLKHGYCEEHKDKSSSWEAHNKKKEANGPRVYQTKGWRYYIRPKVKELSNGLCLNHLRGNPSVVVQGRITEHIIPVSKGGSNEFTNLSFFCDECAKNKTGWERNKSIEDILKKYSHTSVV